MKKLLLWILVLGSIGGGIATYYLRQTEEPPQVMTAAVTRGDIIDSVGATGTLEAVNTVQVGTQVSGTIKELYADFNSIVRAGQVVARLDPSLFQTQIDQARANLVRAQADVERLRVTLEDAKTKLARAEGLAAKSLIPVSELDTARVAVKSAQAQLQSSEAQVTQSRASLSQAEVNLEHTVIRTPINGIVISRNVDVGQTVAASMQAPTLFIIAADLTKMKVNANIDEADVGRIRPGQLVRFRVDAFPTEEFTGTVSQVRLNPSVVQNVVTYATVIDVPNPNLKLKPGMTANVTLEIARKNNVVRIPNAALRFRPTTEMLAALKQPVPAETLVQGRRLMPAAGQTSGTPAAAPTAATNGKLAAGGPPPAGRAPSAASGPETPSEPTDARGSQRPAGGQQPSDDSGTARSAEDAQPQGGRGGAIDPEQRRQFMERMQNMTPEQRQQAMQGFGGRRAGGQGPAAAGGQGPGVEGRAGSGAGGQTPETAGERSATGARVTAGAQQKPVVAARAATAQTIDSLFGPLPPTESVGRVWLHVDNQLKPVAVRLGITDGNYTELLSGDIPPNAELVTNIITTAMTSTTAATGRSPLMPQGRGGMPPGGIIIRGGGR